MTDKNMTSILNQLASPLEKEDIELRVGSVFQKGFTLLLYKTARTDVRRLNEVCGTRWKNKHYYDDAKLLCCEISIYDDEIKEWIGRSDVGTESNTEKEKGYYSDSFKRAGFRWGIGIELYNSPFTFIPWETEQTEFNGKKQYKLKNFYPADLDILAYKVENGFPFYTITHKGKNVWSNVKDAKVEKVEVKKTTAKAQNVEWVSLSNQIDGATYQQLEDKNFMIFIQRGIIAQFEREPQCGYSLIDLINSKFKNSDIQKQYEIKDGKINVVFDLIDDEVPSFT